jgi:hypothetical protein
MAAKKTKRKPVAPKRVTKPAKRPAPKRTGAPGKVSHPRGSRKRKPSAWVREFTLKPNRVLGVCGIARCSEQTGSNKVKWCLKHRVAIRKAQMAANNETWKKRLAQGTATIRPLYRGKPTRSSMLRAA